MRLSFSRFDPRVVAGVAALSVVLIAQGVALTNSIALAAPLICMLVIAVAVEVPVVPFLGFLLFVRVLTDEQVSNAGRASGTVNLQALIAGLLILVAAGLLLRRRKGLVPITMIAISIAIWTSVAVLTHGAGTIVVREGVRELSILAIAIIALNSRNALSMPVVTRIIQFAGITAALLAVFQLVTGGGMHIGHELRANGTFDHPNSAAVYFALAAVSSLWRYVDCGRRRLDLMFGVSFAAAALATFSIDGFASLLVMLLTFGFLRSRSRRLKVRAAVLVGALMAAFVFSPVGSERLESQGSTNFAGSQIRHGSSSSLEWRLYKWGTLIPEWEKSPFIGKGLGTTITSEATATNSTVGNLPHNEYVRYLVETGIFGLGVLLTGLVLLMRRLNRARKRVEPQSGVATLGVAVLTGLMVNAMAANTLLYTPAAFAAALLIATAVRSSIPIPSKRRWARAPIHARAAVA